MMEYRKYKANTLKEAKLKMMMDVGRRGYIIDQKRIKEGGVLGLGGKTVVEITVGVLNHSSIPNTTKKDGEGDLKTSLYRDIVQGKSNFDVKNPFKEKPMEVAEEILDNNVEDEWNAKDAMESVQEISKKISQYYKTQNHNKMQEINNLHNTQKLKEKSSYINSLKSNMMYKTVPPSGGYDDYKEDDINDESKNYDDEKEVINKNSEGEQLLRLIKDKPKNEFVKFLLHDMDFEEAIIEELLTEYSGKSLNESSIMEAMISKITDTVVAMEGLKLHTDHPTVICVVGPTGAGKTTTIAKLAAYFGVMQQKSVELISIDRYRVGAIQQLKLYSEIMGLPFKKVNTLQEFKHLMDNITSDLVLIDTSGRSPKDIEGIDEIKDYLDLIPHYRYISLVLSATTKYNDLISVLENFNRIKYNNVILTKIDETNSYGQVISALIKKKCNLSYLGVGQRVPEDITEASLDKIKNLIGEKETIV